MTKISGLRNCSALNGFVLSLPLQLMDCVKYFNLHMPEFARGEGKRASQGALRGLGCATECAGCDEV